MSCLAYHRGMPVITIATSSHQARHAAVSVSIHQSKDSLVRARPLQKSIVVGIVLNSVSIRESNCA